MEEINYKYVLFKTDPGIGYGVYNDSHYEVHRMISTTDVKDFENMLSDYYAMVIPIIVSCDEKAILDYCDDNGIKLDIEYERKWYGCYEWNTVYGGTFNRADGFSDLYVVDDAPKDDPAKMVADYGIFEIAGLKEKKYG